MNTGTTKWAIERAVFRDHRGETSRAWIREIPALPASARLVMSALLSRADAENGSIGEEHTPSLTELAELTGLDRSTIRRNLNLLEKQNWVVRHRPDPTDARSKSARTWYQLGVPGRDAVPLADAGVGASRPQGDEPGRGTVPLGRGTTPPVEPGEVEAPRPQSGGTTPLPVGAPRPWGRGTTPPIPLFTPETTKDTPTPPVQARPKPHRRQGPTDADSKTRTRATTPRGTRLPGDWKPDPDLVAWTYRETGLVPDEARREFDKFRDYWKSQPGQKGVRTDWDATWRNWARKADDDKQRRTPRRPWPANNAERGADILARAKTRLDGAGPAPDHHQTSMYVVIEGETA